MNPLLPTSPSPAPDHSWSPSAPWQGDNSSTRGLPPLCYNSTSPEALEAGLVQRAAGACLWPELMENKRYTLHVYGHVSLVVVILTIITNGFVCLVLLQKNMRTPTNLLLVAMAIADTLTGVFPIPTFFYFYTMGHHADYVPYVWCIANPALQLHLPTVTHTASIWLTVALAAQRYIYVCHSQHAKSLCTVSNAIKCIAAVYILAVVSQVSRFVEYEFHPLKLQSLLEDNNESSGLLDHDSNENNPGLLDSAAGGLMGRRVIVGCYQQMIPFVRDNVDVILGVYWWFRLVFIHLVPCALLVILNALLFHAMRSAQVRRDVLLRQNRRTESHRLAESNLATLMLLSVVTLFLFVEFPLAILLMTMIYENTYDHLPPLIDPEERRVAGLFINLCILLSYPVNFFIYCGMSRQFRQTFKSLFLGGAAGKGAEESGDHRRNHAGMPSSCPTIEMHMTRLSVGGHKD